MDGMPEYLVEDAPVTLAGSFSPDGAYFASPGRDAVRVVGLRDDRDVTIKAWRCTIRESGFGPQEVPTLLLVRVDRSGRSHLGLWTPSGCCDLDVSFDSDIDAWWCSDGRVLVRALGVCEGGMWVVDPAAGAVLAA